MKTTDKGTLKSSLCPVYITANSALSALGKNIAVRDSLSEAQQLHRLPEPFDCFYHSILNYPVNGSYQRIFQLLSEVVDNVIFQQKLSVAELAQTTLFLGSSSMDIGAIKSDKERELWLTTLDHLNSYLVQKYGLQPLHFTFSTACTSSSNALIYATRLIRANEIKQAIVLGAEFYNPLTIQGFNSLELLSIKGCEAFSKHRDGMVLGEGVAALFLSKKPTSDTSIAVMEGYSSCDTYSLTATEEDGSKIGEVIENSLQLSGLTANDIQLIKAHGTASVASDEAEANALNRVFSSQVPSLALKPFIGHTLGACGVLEISLLIDLIKQDVMPEMGYAKTLNKDDVLLDLVSGDSSFKQINYILANHCGFGGNNAAIILKNVHHSDCRAFEDEDIETIELERNQQLATIAQSKVKHDCLVSAKDFRKQVKLVTGFEVRRKDSFTLIALQALYELFTQAEIAALNLSECKLGLYGVGDYFSVELLQSLILTIETGDDVRPLDFISSVGNSANFYLAQQFNILDVNLFTGASRNAKQRIEKLALVDLQNHIVDYAIIVNWQQDEKYNVCETSLVALP